MNEEMKLKIEKMQLMLNEIINKEENNTKKEMDVADENYVNELYVGQYVIVRSYDSGVHFGKLQKYNEYSRHAVLENARRLFYWKAFTLSEASLHGMSDDEAKISEKLEQIIIANVIELIPCTSAAIKDLSEYESYKC